MSLDGQEPELRKGDGVFVPRGAVHGFEELHPEVDRSISVLGPGLDWPPLPRELAAVVNAQGSPTANWLACDLTVKVVIYPRIPGQEAPPPLRLT
jgi:hypothetical protein